MSLLPQNKNSLKYANIGSIVHSRILWMCIIYSGASAACMYRRVRALKSLVPVLRVVLHMTTYSSFRNSHPRWQHVCFFLKQLCDCLNPFFSCTTMVPLTKLLEQVIRQTRQLSLYFREGSATLHFLWKTRKKER